MKKTTIITTLILAFTIAAFAQKIPGERPVINFNPQMIGGVYQPTNHKTFKKKDEFKGVLGSFYLYEKWSQSSTIETKSGKKYVMSNLNFDLDEEKFLSKLSKDSVYIYQNLSRVIINNRIFKNIDGKFYQTLSDKGGVVLLKNFSGKLKNPVVNQMTNQIVKPAEYVKVEKYFIQKDGEDILVRLRLKKSKILKALYDKQEEVKAFVSKNNLSYDNEIDVIKIVNYYNTLS
jgi:hypothetical protein